MKSEIELGSLVIPIIKPVKGVDYFTNAEIQEIVNSLQVEINARIDAAEAARESNESTRQQNELARQEAKAVLDNFISNLQTMLEHGDFKGEAGVGISNIAINENGILTATMTDGMVYTSQSLKGEKGDTGARGEQRTTRRARRTRRTRYSGRRRI